VHVDADSWIDALPQALASHAIVLRRLVAESRNDQRIRVLVVGCSIGRGVADELSDVDAYMAVAPSELVAYLAGTEAMLSRLGNLVDWSQQRNAVDGRAADRIIWALYSDGVQLELVIASAPGELEGRRDWVVLYDPDKRVSGTKPEAFASLDDVRRWSYEGWSLLLLCAKYLRRRSLWEALETLHAARTRVWRVWAAARRVPDPQFGLTAVLDSSDPSAPAGLEATHATLDLAALARAALACADLLNALWPEATATVDGRSRSLPNAAEAARHELIKIASS
jgi:predicted nucleotidyltransferase